MGVFVRQDHRGITLSIMISDQILPVILKSTMHVLNFVRVSHKWLYPNWCSIHSRTHKRVNVVTTDTRNVVATTYHEFRVSVFNPSGSIEPLRPSEQC